MAKRREQRLIEFEAEEAQPSLRTLWSLLDSGLTPADLRWVDAADGQAELWGAEAPASRVAAPSADDTATATRAAARLPAGFLELARWVAMHASADRFHRLHQMALAVGENSRCWNDRLDPLRLSLERMAQEVRREIHKMHAFVRFRPLEEADGLRHVAWFEPRHHIVRAAVPFFVDRFASMRWAILTPRLCAQWDRQSLAFSAGAQRAQAPGPDAGEALWLTYYRSIFNPSRLKTQAMLREMPRRYWRNLPEAQAISELVRCAPERSAQMVLHTGDATRRRPASPGATATAAHCGGEGGEASSRARRLRSAELVARRCHECPCAQTATQIVWGEGPVDARLMIVGEQPGDHEDLAGRPFVGPAGQLLRQAMSALGWPTDRIYLTNAVKHFHFELRGKRRMHKTPGALAAEACAQWLDAEIAMVRPKALLALGSTAAASLLGPGVRVTDLLGRWWPRADGRPVWAVHHPAAILRRAQTQAPTFDEWVQALRPAMHDAPEAQALS